MPRYIAFLRAINVGGHIVKMSRLKELFVSLGYTDVEQFIASGNVIFRSPARDSTALEAKIESRLARELGYEVKTFIRSDREVSDVARREPFSAAAGATLYVGFLKAEPARAAAERLQAAQTDIDDLAVIGRELYWQCRVASSESTLSGAKLEKTLGMPTTLRNVNTVRRLATNYPACS